jgi:V/A-type H+-transporting ATPase subunit C
LIHFEVALEKVIAGQGLKALSRSILSLGSIIGFLFLKEEEVSNIRKIVRAKEYDLPLNKVKEMLVQVS